MARTRKTALTLAVLPALLGISVLAGPPLVTDDPETPGPHGWEVNISHNIEKTRDELLMESPLIDINRGFVENDQFKVEFAVVAVEPEHEPNHWGVGDLLIGYKYRFLEEDENGFMASVYPQVLAPTGNERFGLGDGRTELFLPVQVAKHFYDEKLFLFAELGYNVVFENEDDNSWHYGIAASWQCNERFSLLAEVGGEVFPRGDEPDDVFFNIGSKYKFNDCVALIDSFGRSFRDRDPGTPEFMSFVGLQMTWGAQEGKPASGNARNE